MRKNATFQAHFSPFPLRRPQALLRSRYSTEWKGIVNSLMAFVQYERIGHKLERPMYLWGIEPTQRGYCHLHIVFIGISWLISIERLVEWWTKNGYGDSAGVELKAIRPYSNEARKAIRYIAKYITKPISSPAGTALFT